MNGGLAYGQKAEIADELAALSRELYERGWMPGTAGNLSVRLPDGHAVITGSGRDKGTLTRQDMALVDAGTGGQLSPGPPRASAETTIHAAVYRTTRARAVVHVHSPYATAVACRAGDPARTRIFPLTGFELLKGLGLNDPAATDLPVFPNWREVPRIAADVAEHLGGTADAPPGFLITDHGITTWGDDLRQARNRLECLESICQLLLLTGKTDPTGPRGREENS